MIADSKQCSLSVIIPYYNRLDDLRLLLSALEVQVRQSPYSIEVIVVDNASTIPPAPLQAQCSWVKWQDEVRPGPARARNKGVSCALGNWVAFLDGDIVPDEKWLSTGLQYCIEVNNPKLIVGGKIEPRFVHNSFIERVDAESLNQQYFIEHLQRAATGNFWISRQFFLELGGFKEGLILYEDFELVKRSLSHGATLHYLPSCIGKHRVRAELFTLCTRSKRQARAFIVSMRSCGISSSLKIFGTTVIARLGKLSKVLKGNGDMLPSSLLVRLARCALLVHEIFFVGYYLITSPKSEASDVDLMQRSQR
jgi:cellulose synthase/poly-beta-1,6-N-acetylglucosamine synthase-like glycosyltransferase